MKEKLVNIELSFTASLDQALRLLSDFMLHSNDTESIDTLTNLLYTQWYTKSGIKKENILLPHSEWAEVFRSVHKGTYLWHKGWKVMKVSSAGRVIAVNGEEERMLYPGDYISLVRPGLLPVPGTEIEVVSRRDTTEDQPGFWIAYSSTWSHVSKLIIRIYWNINPEGAVHLVKQISEKIPDDIPYSFKLPVEPIGYQRADVAVLYFETSNFDELKASIKSIYTAMIPFLYSEVPEFTKILEHGVGLAEDPPGESESFGLNRCRLIAEGYQVAKKMHTNDFSAMKTVIKNYLDENGVNLAHPYLNPGSTNDYKW